MLTLRSSLRSPIAVGLVWLALAALVPTFYGSGTVRLGQYNYILSILMIAVGLNLVLGYAGQLFLGPGALAAAGAYGAALLAKDHTVWQSLPAMCVAAIVVALVIAALAAIPTLRVSGFYLGLVTLFLAQVIPVVASHSERLGKDNGISLVAVPSFTQHPSGLALYETGVGVLGLMALYCYLVVRSRLGRRFTTIRSSDELAQAVGVPTYKTKLTAFMLASVPCAVGGAFYLYSQQFISPQSFTPQLSIYILAGLVIGGGGTIIGPILGTAAVMWINVFMGETLNNPDLNKYQGIIFGAILVVVAMALPRGLIGVAFDAKAWWARRRGLDRRFTAPPAILAHAAETTNADTAETGDTTEPAAPQAAPDVVVGERLVVRGATRAFGGVVAVDAVDLVVEPGTVHALVGPNGSGKTTLLNLISGYYKLQGGEILLGDEHLDGRRAADITRMGVARTFQTPKLSEYDTATGNVLVGADRTSPGTLLGGVLHTRKARRANAAAMERSLAALAQVGLAEDAYTLAAELPHGTQRLVEIARVAALRPRLVLLDEPAAGLSVAETEKLKDVVRGMARSGLAVLLVEHNLPVVFDVADHVTVLDQGAVLSSGSPAHVSTDPEVIRVYLGRSRPDPKAAQVLVGELLDES